MQTTQQNAAQVKPAINLEIYGHWPIKYMHVRVPSELPSLAAHVSADMSFTS